MPLFDEAWCASVVEHFNGEPDAAAAAAGWRGAFGIVVQRPGDDVGVYVGAPVGGRLPRPELMSAAALEALAPAYFARAAEDDWRALIEGRLDPIAALVQKRLIARGDLAQAMARLQYRGLVDRWLEKVRANLRAP